eukprot:scaffold8315_cov50-Attheya_sp.AAC.3
MLLLPHPAASLTMRYHAASSLAATTTTLPMPFSAYPQVAGSSLWALQQQRKNPFMEEFEGRERGGGIVRNRSMRSVSRGSVTRLQVTPLGVVSSGVVSSKPQLLVAPMALRRILNGPFLMGFLLGGLMCSTVLMVVGAILVLGSENCRRVLGMRKLLMDRVWNRFCQALGTAQGTLRQTKSLPDTWKVLWVALVDTRKAAAQALETLRQEAGLVAAAVGKPGLVALQYSVDHLTPKFFAASLEQSLRESLSSVKDKNVRNIELVEFNVGSKTPELLDARAYELGEDAMAFDVDVRWDSELRAKIMVETSLQIKVPLSVRNFRFVGVVRVVLAPLTPEPPGFGALLVSFPAAPTVGLDIRMAGGEITKMPWLRQEILSAIQEGIEDEYLWPRRVVIPSPAAPPMDTILETMLSPEALNDLKTSDPLLRAERSLQENAAFYPDEPNNNDDNDPKQVKVVERRIIIPPWGKGKKDETNKEGVDEDEEKRKKMNPFLPLERIWKPSVEFVSDRIVPLERFWRPSVEFVSDRIVSPGMAGMEVVGKFYQENVWEKIRHDTKERQSMVGLNSDADVPMQLDILVKEEECADEEECLLEVWSTDATKEKAIQEYYFDREIGWRTSFDVLKRPFSRIKKRFRNKFVRSSETNPTNESLSTKNVTTLVDDNNSNIMEQRQQQQQVPLVSKDDPKDDLDGIGNTINNSNVTSSSIHHGESSSPISVTIPVQDMNQDEQCGIDDDILYPSEVDHWDDELRDDSLLPKRAWRPSFSVAIRSPISRLSKKVRSSWQRIKTKSQNKIPQQTIQEDSIRNETPLLDTQVPTTHALEVPGSTNYDKNGDEKSFVIADDDSGSSFVIVDTEEDRAKETIEHNIPSNVTKVASPLYQESSSNDLDVAPDYREQHALRPKGAWSYFSDKPKKERMVDDKPLQDRADAVQTDAIHVKEVVSSVHTDDVTFSRESNSESPPLDIIRPLDHTREPDVHEPSSRESPLRRRSIIGVIIREKSPISWLTKKIRHGFSGSMNHGTEMAEDEEVPELEEIKSLISPTEDDIDVADEKFSHATYMGSLALNNQLLKEVTTLLEEGGHIEREEVVLINDSSISELEES